MFAPYGVPAFTLTPLERRSVNSRDVSGLKPSVMNGFARKVSAPRNGPGSTRPAAGVIADARNMASAAVKIWSSVAVSAGQRGAPCIEWCT
jgi:hypothetical protein